MPHETLTDEIRRHARHAAQLRRGEGYARRLTVAERETVGASYLDHARALWRGRDHAYYWEEGGCWQLRAAP